MSVAVTDFPAKLRVATAADVPAMYRIEDSVYEFPWTEGIFSDCINAGYLCLVYENAHELFAYGVMSFVDGECHILNLCVDSDYQGCGWGRNLLLRLLELARQRNCRIAFLEVRVSNKRAFNLYHNLGFNEIAVRKRYYPARAGRRENALVLARVLEQE